MTAPEDMDRAMSEEERERLRVYLASEAFDDEPEEFDPVIFRDMSVVFSLVATSASQIEAAANLTPPNVLAALRLTDALQTLRTAEVALQEAMDAIIEGQKENQG